MSDNSGGKLSVGCEGGVQLYLNTVASPGGTGWQLACRAGKFNLNGGVTPALAIGYSSASLEGKILAGDSGPGKTTKGNPNSFSAGLQRQEDSFLFGHNDSHSRRQVMRTATFFGVGNYTIPASSTNDNTDIEWLTYSIRRHTSGGMELWGGSDGAYGLVSASFVTESVLAYQKPANTLRDDARRILVMVSFEAGYRTSLTQFNSDDERDNKGLTLSRFYFMYDDFMKSLSKVMEYYAIDRDAAISEGQLSIATGAPEITFKPGPMSGKSHLLTLSHAADAIGSAAQRRHFASISDDWKDTLLFYLGARSVAMLVFAGSDETRVMSAAATASVRSFADALALRYTDTNFDTLKWHIGISGALVLLGALGGRDSDAGGRLMRGIAEGGMGGLSATMWDPNPRDSTGFAQNKRYSVLVASHYSRVTNSPNGPGVENSRGTIRAETSIGDGSIYTAVSGSSSYLSLGEKNAAVPTANDAIVGMQGSKIISGDADGGVQVRGGIGIGARMGNSDAGAEFGAVGEAVAALVIRPRANFSIDLIGRCSATLYASGHDNDCSFGGGITIYNILPTL
jgi:hypothetical protein